MVREHQRKLALASKGRRAATGSEAGSCSEASHDTTDQLGLVEKFFAAVGTVNNLQQKMRALEFRCDQVHSMVQGMSCVRLVVHQTCWIRQASRTLRCTPEHHLRVASVLMGRSSSHATCGTASLEC